jgi:diacylglycerol O-acyltransferase / wax synthase
VLWLCSTALREYLAESRELPAQSLVAGVPISLRSEGDTSSNNQVSGTFIDLATHIKDPIERLRMIMAGTKAMKQQIGAFGSLIPTDFPSMGSPWLLSGLASLYGRSRIAGWLRIANVVISNVPGPQIPLYLAGAKMVGNYPLSIVVHGVALNITVQSYMGQLDFGLIACRRAMRDVDHLAVQLNKALDVLRRLPQAAPLASVVDVKPVATVPPVAPAAVKRKKPQLSVVGSKSKLAPKKVAAKTAHRKSALPSRKPKLTRAA